MFKISPIVFVAAFVKSMSRIIPTAAPNTVDSGKLNEQKNIKAFYSKFGETYSSKWETSRQNLGRKGLGNPLAKIHLVLPTNLITNK